MNFYLLWAMTKYDGLELSEFQTEADMLAFVNQRAGDPDLRLRAFTGREIVLEPVEVAKQYRVGR